jgi:hypothetical protein
MPFLIFIHTVKYSKFKKYIVPFNNQTYQHCPVEVIKSMLEIAAPITPQVTESHNPIAKIYPSFYLKDMTKYTPDIANGENTPKSTNWVHLLHRNR